ncbi:hypothetical protein OVY01_17450 [Robbsia sp. Bb-Pol-6]|uniref:Lipoprotein n=1 Tax=Robbsia betulipollinis TaxID=2981849 RepID=A0ABT3ZQY1_9BURK|nr:hypothetical protein [Robbsia betulipollinis]MCY0388963.1 hypothetical protein [Robbsia betulipollinis]
MAQAPVAVAPPVMAQAPVAVAPPVMAQAPVAVAPPVMAQAPVVVAPPVVAHAPVVVAPPVVAQAPVVVAPPVVAQAPVVVAPPVIAQAPSRIAAQAPVAQTSKMVAPAPATPVETATPAASRPVIVAVTPAVVPATAPVAQEPINTLDNGQIIGRIVSSNRRAAVATCLYSYLADFSNGLKSAKDATPDMTVSQIDIGMVPPHAHRSLFGSSNDAGYQAYYRLSLVDRATGTTITIQQGPNAFTPLSREMLMDIVSACGAGK